ncbi:SWIM zinc finger family protein [Bacillus cereus]|uniref:SWIM zinc finger family protein n=1 Tax=Bacillus cereus TaxID=1396 RepID=UPI000B4B63B2|nr:SWIM zinc finger family protein [Bacillus cereus]
MYAYLIKELYRHIPKYIIDRGYEYYEVVIDLEDFSESNCECPYENYCKHMAAVVYDMQDAGESKVKEKLKDLEKEELLTVLNRLLQSSKNVQIVEKLLKKG